MNILAAFAGQVARHPDRVAIVDGRGRATTYRALDARAAALAADWHRRGLRSGDRVLLALPLDAELYAALAALWRIGAAAVLPEPAMGLAGLRHAARTTAPRALLTSGVYRLLRFLPALRRIELRLSPGRGAGDHPIADLPDEAPALLSFTTGSTGTPKTIVRSHGFLAAQDRALAPLIAADGREEVDLVAFPVFVVANLGQGVTSVLPNWPLRRPLRADGAAIRAHAERHGVTRLLLSPAIADALAAAGLPREAHSLFTGGGPVFPDLIARLQSAAPALRIVAVYGSTEAEPIAEIDAAAIGAGDWAEMRSGGGLLAGPPVPGIGLRIVDDEIWVSGDHVVRAYLDPAADASTKVRDADGTVWHRTGDGGRLDGDGRLWLRGRVKGRPAGLWPFEVEAVARSWNGVRRAALGRRGDAAVLAVEGDAGQADAWRAAAAVHGVDRVLPVARIPLDRRHGSKVDQAALERMLRAGG